MNRRRIGIISFVLIVIAITVIFVGKSTLIGHSVVNVAFALEGAETQAQVKGVDGLWLAKISFIKQVKGASVEFAENSRIPFDGKAYNKFNINSRWAGWFKDVELTVKLQEQKLRDVEIGLHQVKLYVNGVERDLELSKQENGYAFYEVVVREEGDFVIGLANPKPVVGSAIEEPAEEAVQEEASEEDIAPEPAVVTESEDSESSAQPAEPEAVAEPQMQSPRDIWNQYKLYIISGAVALVCILFIALLGGRKKKAKQEHDVGSLSEWLELELSAGTKKKDARKMLQGYTGWKKKDVLKQFPKLK